MAGYSPAGRYGLIALIAARRLKAEKIRRDHLAHAKSAKEAEKLKEAGREERRSGWFR